MLKLLSQELAGSLGSVYNRKKTNLAKKLPERQVPPRIEHCKHLPDRNLATFAIGSHERFADAP